jgi:hypothetical protein
MTPNMRFTRGLRRGLAIAALASLAACVNPNAIGVQDTGSVYGRVIDATSQQPIAGAIVSVNAVLNQKTSAAGTFNIQAVPIGTQTLTIYANGYQTNTVQVVVTKNNASDAALVSLTPAQ